MIRVLMVVAVLAGGFLIGAGAKILTSPLLEKRQARLVIPAADPPGASSKKSADAVDVPVPEIEFPTAPPTIDVSVNVAPPVDGSPSIPATVSVPPADVSKIGPTPASKRSTKPDPRRAIDMAAVADLIGATRKADASARIHERNVAAERSALIRASVVRRDEAAETWRDRAMRGPEN